MQILTLIVVAVFSILMISRLFNMSGLPIAGNSSVSSFLNKDSRMTASNTIINWKESAYIGGQALVFRLFVYLISYLCLIFIAKNGQTFYEWWLKWDATNYIGIADGGYYNITINDVPELGNNVPQTLAFFPLYPFIVWAVSMIIPNIYLSAFITSTVLFIFGCIFLYKAVAYRYNRSIAEKTVVLISCFPFAFYFGGMLPESTFLFTASACLYYTFRKNWTVAGLFGMLTAVSRLQGIIIIGFMGIEWLEEYRILELLKLKKFKEFGIKLIYLIPIAFTAVGSFIYLLVNYLTTQDFFYFLKLQKNVWGHSFKDVGTGIATIVNDQILSADTEYVIKLSVWIPELLLFIIVMYLLFRYHREHSNSLIAFLFVYTLVSYSSDIVISAGRYLSIALPLFIILGKVCEKKQRLYAWLVATFAMLQVVYMYCHISGFNMVT